MVQLREPHHRPESDVLESFALRWSVLAAWLHELRGRESAVDPRMATLLESTRLKIASGVFSVCEVGCDLARMEAALVSRTASVDPESVETWLDALRESMTEPERTRSRPWYRAISSPALDCGYRSCVCPV